MKKRLLMIALVLVCVLVLSACGCKHETWKDADCVNPKTCADCGETEGAPLGHTWQAATCEKAKTCEACGETEGAALGHSWVDADCENAKTCSTCSLTEGEALGHDWQEATTEAPKTCAACALTEGERIVTDPRFTTAATKDIQGTWVCAVPMTGEMLGYEGMEGEFACQIILELHNDATMELRYAIENEAAFKEAMEVYLVDTMYAELKAAGLNKTQADEAMLQEYGMDVKQYVSVVMATLDVGAIFESMTLSGLYYVEDGKFYLGISWEMEMEPTNFTLEGDTLTLMDDVAGDGSEQTVFKRVTE